ncbi:MAG: hypothetical protein JJU02_04685 [Cryomorphaceae bacterium]|nr:hypothetical protein [Cryomorphaceae bacterium]
MTRKFIVFTFCYFALGIISFTSCGYLLRYDATICDIRFAGLHSMFKHNSEGPDTFDDQIGFEIMSVESSPTCYFPSAQIFNSAHATTKCAKFTNRLLKTSYKISLDRPIVFDGDTIGSTTDLLSVSRFKDLTQITINEEECEEFVTSEIIFTTELTNKIQFESGVYEVTFKCSTSDNREFEKTRHVIFKD